MSLLKVLGQILTIDQKLSTHEQTSNITLNKKTVELKAFAHDFKAFIQTTQITSDTQKEIK